MSDLDRFLNSGGSAWAPGRLPEELLQMAREAGSGMVVELLGIFQEDSMVHLEELSRAIVNGDSGAIQSEAHSLKGSAAQIGAAVVSDLCRQMERLSETGTALEQTAIYEQIAAALREVLERIPGFQVIAAESSNVS